MTQVPYESAASLLDCKKPIGGGYSKPAYPDKPACGENYPAGSCDNRFYGAYSLSATYNGYVDDCMNPWDTKKACDLAYVNSTPLTNIQCWNKCCGQSGKDCDMKCHVACVVDNTPKKPPTPASNP
jgi:hypothetical protein